MTNTRTLRKLELSKSIQTLASGLLIGLSLTIAAPNAANAGAPGPTVINGDGLVDELVTNSGIELFINNPAAGPLGPVSSMAAAIDNQPFSASTNNGWGASSLFSESAWTAPGGAGAGMSWAEVFGVNFNDAFPGFVFDQRTDVVLAYRSAPNGTNVTPGTTQGGFFGNLPGAIFATQIILGGNGVVAIGQTNQIPEPAVVALFGLGLAAMGGLARRRQNKKA